MDFITIPVWDNRARVERLVRYIDNGDGTISPVAGGGASGTPLAGSLSATTTGQPLSAVSVPCNGVLVFPTDASADVYIGDEDSQPCRIPGVGILIPADDVSKVYGKLSTGTGDIPWIAIT